MIQLGHLIKSSITEMKLLNGKKTKNKELNDCDDEFSVDYLLIELFQLYIKIERVLKLKLLSDEMSAKSVILHHILCISLESNNKEKTTSASIDNINKRKTVNNNKKPTKIT